MPSIISVGHLDYSKWIGVNEVRIPQRIRASVERIAIAEDRYPAQVVRRLLIRALAQHEREKGDEQ
jgi:hypothetical protein